MFWNLIKLLPTIWKVFGVLKSIGKKIKDAWYKFRKKETNEAESPIDFEDVI